MYIFFYKKLLKAEFSRCAEDSVFGSMDHIQKFVAARLPQNYNNDVFSLPPWFCPFHKKQSAFFVYRCCCIDCSCFEFCIFVFLQKQRRLSMLVHDMCSEISVQIGRFVQGVGKLEEEEVEPAATSVSRVASVRQSARQIKGSGKSETAE